MRRHGKTTPLNIVSYNSICSLQNCSEDHHAKGYCNTHYRRFLKYGRADLKRVKYSMSNTSSSAGYRLLSRVGHPLADKAGRIYEHRVVLYDKIGPGSHKCHWCLKIINWDDGTLTVDHLDFDRKNNDPENLEPSCLSCNSKRTYYKGMEVDD
jgi:hypothetical protein